MIHSYKAKIISVYDGDTFTFLVDLGFSITVTERLRLYGINTPEIRLSSKTNQEEKMRGITVRDYVRELILNKDVHIIVYKKGKYGRYVASVEVETTQGEHIDLSDHLVSQGMAVEVKY